MPWAASVSSSIATSPPPLPANVGPAYLSGTHLYSVQDCTLTPASSFIVMTTLRCWLTPPVRVASIHSHRSFDEITPRLHVTSFVLHKRGILLTCISAALPLRYSAMANSVPSPETSEKPPIALVASTPGDLRSTMKL